MTLKHTVGDAWADAIIPPVTVADADDGNLSTI